MPFASRTTRSAWTHAGYMEFAAAVGGVAIVIAYTGFATGSICNILAMAQPSNF